MIISLLKPRQQRKHFPHKTLCLLFLFLFCVNDTPSFLAIVARYFMSADFTSHCICLTSVTISLCGPVHRVQSNHIKQVRGSLLSGLGIRFQNLNLLHFDQITGLKSLSIYLFLLAQLNLGLQIDRLPVQASQVALCSEGRTGECACASEWRSCFSGDNFRTFLDLKTTFWLSFYYFLHCIILFLHCRLSFSKLTLDFGIFNVYQIRAIF